MILLTLIFVDDDSRWIPGNTRKRKSTREKEKACHETWILWAKATGDY